MFGAAVCSAASSTSITPSQHENQGFAPHTLYNQISAQGGQAMRWHIKCSG
jgi:hypothetical protein